MRDEMPSPYPVWPKIGFSEWWHRQQNGLCRMCEDGEHKDCLDSSEEWNECDCATKGHVEVPGLRPPEPDKPEVAQS
jgi:hypothetical protein